MYPRSACLNVKKALSNSYCWCDWEVIFRTCEITTKIFQKGKLKLNKILLKNLHTNRVPKYDLFAASLHFNYFFKSLIGKYKTI